MVMLLSQSLGDDLQVVKPFSVVSDRQSFWDWHRRMEQFVRTKAAEGWHIIEGHRPTINCEGVSGDSLMYRFTCKLTRWSSELPECEAIGTLENRP